MPAKLHKKGENTKDTGGMLSHYRPYPIYKRYNLMLETETEINPERLRTHTLPEGIHEIGRIHILVLIVITVFRRPPKRHGISYRPNGLPHLRIWPSKPQPHRS